VRILEQLFQFKLFYCLLYRSKYSIAKLERVIEYADTVGKLFFVFYILSSFRKYPVGWLFVSSTIKD